MMPDTHSASDLSDHLQLGKFNGRSVMEFRQLGGSGFKVPALCLGTGTFGGKNEFFRAWGATEVEEATQLVDICAGSGPEYV